MFSRYRIYHFKDFTCILPVSIDSGKTHQKSPAHSLVFLGFFCKMYLADFQDWLYHKVHIYLENHSVYPLIRIGTPHPLSRKRVCGSPIRRLEKKLSILSTLWSVLNPRKIYKKGFRNCPRLSMYTTGVEKKSNMCHPGIEFWRRRPHDTN